MAATKSRARIGDGPNHPKSKLNIEVREAPTNVIVIPTTEILDKNPRVTNDTSHPTKKRRLSIVDRALENVSRRKAKTIKFRMAVNLTKDVVRQSTRERGKRSTVATCQSRQNILAKDTRKAATRLIARKFLDLRATIPEEIKRIAITLNTIRKITINLIKTPREGNLTNYPKNPTPWTLRTQSMRYV